MRNRKFILVLSLLLYSTAAVRAQDTGPKMMNLEECLEYAFKNNASVLNAEIETRISKATIGETRADGLPQVNGSIDYTNNPAIRVQPLPDFLSPVIYGVLEREGLATAPAEGFGGVLPAAFGTTHTGNAALTASQMLFDASYFIALNAARTYKSLAEDDLRLTKIELAENVTKAYYNVLINREMLELAENSFARVDSLYRETRIMNENGFAERIDVQRVQVNFNNAKTLANNTRRLMEVSNQVLKVYLGMPFDQELEIAGDIADVEFDETVSSDASDFEYGDRVEFNRLNTNILLNKLDIKRNTANYFPKLNLTGQYGYVMGTNNSSDLFNFNGDNRTWFKYASVGITMEIPIFDGLRKSYTIQKGKLQGMQLENQKKNLKNSIDLEIDQSYTQLVNSVETLTAERENMKLAEEVYNTSKIKYQEGVGSNLEVIEADNAFKEAQTNYFNALYNALIAKIENDKALGILIEQ